MQQPELGLRLIALRKQKNLTQEELVEKSNVSVRTIQRIENGDVLPRISTVKILLKALEESYESFSTTSSQTEAAVSTPPHASRNLLLVAAIAGAVYLVSQMILGAMDVARFTGDDEWHFSVLVIYTSLKTVMVISFALFGRGFVVLSTIFENTLLKIAAYLLITATLVLAIFDVTSLKIEEVEYLLLPYAVAALLFGTLSIVFGISLLRLQDGMGMLARIAGILEIVMGCLLVTVILFFLTYIILIPATVIEILILFRGYEYLSRSESEQVS
jgi:transcriptional regulator with XRE-family HTH domain